MSMEFLLNAAQKARDLDAAGDRQGATEAVEQAIDAEMKKRLAEVQPIIAMMGFDTHIAPDGMGFVIMPNEMADVVHPIMLGEDMKGALRLRIEVDMLAPARKDPKHAKKVCELFLLDILHNIGNNMSSAASARDFIEKLKKEEDDQGSTIA